MTPEMAQAFEAMTEIYVMETNQTLQFIDLVKDVGILPDFRVDMLQAKLYA